MAPMRRAGASRNPDTVFLFSLCVFAGAGQVAAGAPPGSVEALLPVWAAVLWGVCLVFAGSLVLLGALWHGKEGKKIDRAEGIELIGRCIFGPFALSYAIALSTFQPDPIAASLAAAPFVGFSVSCVVRGWQIVRRRNRALSNGGS